MTDKRKIEIYSLGCPVCKDVIEKVREAACSSCDVIVHDMMLPEVQHSAAALRILSFPAVAVDGVLAGCCAGRGVDIEVLKSAGLGVALE